MSYQTTASGLILPSSVSVKRKPSEDFNEVRIKARNGFVIFERPNDDGSDMQTNQTTVEGAKHRYVAVARHCETCRKHESSYVREKVPAIKRFLERLKAAIEEAEHQGPFSDAGSRRARVRAAPTSVAFPNLSLG